MAISAAGRAVDELAADRARALAEVDVAATVARREGRRRSGAERLAALVAELDQSGAGLQPRGPDPALQRRGAGAPRRREGDASLLGLGRSVFGIIDRNLVLHAVEAWSAAERRAEGALRHRDRRGRLLRVQAAPVPGQAAGATRVARRLRAAASPTSPSRSTPRRARSRSSRTSSRDPRRARQHPRRDRDAGRASGDGGGAAGAVHRHHPGRGGAAVRPAARDHRRRVRAPQGAVAARGDARRGSADARAQPHRAARRARDQARVGRPGAVAAGRQLFARAGPRLSRAPAEGRVRVREVRFRLLPAAGTRSST